MGESLTSFSLINSNISNISNNNSNIIYSNYKKSKNNIKSLKFDSNTNNTQKNSFPYFNDYNKKFNYVLNQIKNLNDHTYDNSNEKMKKNLAFKEIIFTHNKNITSLESKKNSDYTKYKLKNPKKRNIHISNFNSNILRPKSANIQYNTIKTINKKLFLDEDYIDISYIKNTKPTIQINSSMNRIKSKKKSLNNNKINLTDNKKKKFKNLKLNNRPQIFMRRPIPTVKEKYLFSLPKDLIKDTKNKYNFFSYILTDDIYNKNYKKARKKNKSLNKIYNSKNYIKTIYKNNIFNNFVLKSRIEIRNKIKKDIDKICNNIIKNKKIYKPVNLKISELIKKKQKIKLMNDDGDLDQKIKSNPFHINKKSAIK